MLFGVYGCIVEILTFLLGTVSDSHSLVGNSSYLAASCMLVYFNVCTNGPHTFWDSLNCGFWHFCLDVAGIQFTPFPFPHQNKELLVSFLSSNHPPTRMHLTMFVCPLTFWHTPALFCTNFIGQLYIFMILCTFSRWNTLHYLIHGCHHKHPMDGLRLVFPPAATAVLCVPVRIAT